MTETTMTLARMRWNVALLAGCQALFMCVQTMAIATTPLAGYAILGVDKTLATLPLVLTHVGIMLTTIPASLLMGRIGRRAGFSIGTMLGVASGIVSAAAIYQQNFVLLCLGAFLQGSGAAFAWYYRFAAADAADEAFRAKAISLVMAGGVVAGFVGPQAAKWAVNWLDPVIFAGVYVMVIAFSAATFALIQGLRIPSLTQAEQKSAGRPMSEIVRQPTYLVALTSSMFGYGVMTLVMSATPLAMLACGFKFNDSATVIQGHVIAMFLPAFFTGHLIQKFGVLPIIITGAVIQIGCALVNLAGVDFYNFFIANIFVGLGWNFTYVGGTTLLTSTYTPSERAKVQASHDFLVYSTTALAAGLSGVLQAKAGWVLVNVASLPMMGIVILAASWLMLHQRRQKI
ncbi:MAG: MFS transporter [Hyphomicrobiaceae bacterium]|nr:MFS transporter [Hyphomicrobiaceae bacterium]